MEPKHSVTVVPINDVQITPGYEPTASEIRRIMPYLKSQGLIEPLKQDRKGEIGLRDVHDPARLEACKKLEWETVIVAYDNQR